MSTYERDEVTRILLGQSLEDAYTRAQQIEDVELRRSLTLRLNQARDVLAGVRPRLRLVVGPFQRHRQNGLQPPSTADCFAGGDDLPPDGPEAA